MDKGVGLETLLQPQVLGDIGIWRSRLRAVHHLERVATRSGRHLRHQYDISQTNNGQAQRLGILRQVMTRILSVDTQHLVVHLLGEERLGPRVEVVLGDELRLSLVEELGLSTLGIGAKHAARALDKSVECLGRCRQVFYSIALLSHPDQEVIERGNHLES